MRPLSRAEGRENPPTSRSDSLGVVGGGVGVGGQRAEGCEKEGGGCEFGRRRCHYDMRCHYVALGPMPRLRVSMVEAVIIKISLSSNETKI
jgi:hypothetical protein